MSGSGSGSKADAGDTPEVLKAEIERGREAVRAGKFSDACDILSATLERYCLKYGELSKECAEAYLSENSSLALVLPAALPSDGLTFRLHAQGTASR